MENKEDRIPHLLANPEFVRWVKNPDSNLDDFWQKWIELNPDAYADVCRARAIVRGLTIREIRVTAERSERVLEQIIKAENNAISVPTVSKTKTKKWSIPRWVHLSQWFKVAAILVAVITLSILYQSTTFVKYSGQPIELVEKEWIVRNTSYGEKLAITFSDGSSVWLNSGSEIRFPEEFDSLERVVSLSGEGYFEIAKDTLRPFLIDAANLRTKVLGTSFNIDLTKESQYRISLVTGSIEVENTLTADVVALEPGQQLRYSPQSGQTVLTEFSLLDVVGWKEGLLRFRNTTFQEAVAKLERWYGVKIAVEGKPREGWRLTGDYQDQTLDLVLDRMAYIEDFTYSIRQKTVNLKFNAYE